MTMTPDRLSGAFFLLFGLAMYFAIIPVFVEQAEDGSIAPNTLPNILSWMVAISGGWLVLKPTPHQIQDLRFFAGALMHAAILCAGIYAMSWIDFLYVAPFLTLIIMIVIGERRPYWLALGVIVMPAFIWFLITQVLDRSLP